jgi:hypothetical protein
VLEVLHMRLLASFSLAGTHLGTLSGTCCCTHTPHMSSQHVLMRVSSLFEYKRAGLALEGDWCR